MADNGQMVFSGPGPGPTAQDMEIQQSEAATPDFGFHQPYDLNRPAQAGPPPGCPTCDDAEKKKKERERQLAAMGDGKTCPVGDGGPNVSRDGDGSVMGPSRYTQQDWASGKVDQAASDFHNGITPQGREAMDAIDRAKAPWDTFNNVFGWKAETPPGYKAP